MLDDEDVAELTERVNEAISEWQDGGIWARRYARDVSWLLEQVGNVQLKIKLPKEPKPKTKEHA